MAFRESSTEPGTNWQAATDAVLLAASTQRVQMAFGVLVSRYHRDVFRVVWRLSGGHADCEDITQEAFIRLWANPAQVRDPKALKGWLLRVGSNMVMDRYRKKPMEGLEAAENVADNGMAADVQMERTDVSKFVDDALACLPERQRQALALVHFEQHTNIVAAEAMEISVDALESLLARARRRLKVDLGQKGKDMLAAMENGT